MEELVVGPVDATRYQRQDDALRREHCGSTSEPVHLAPVLIDKVDEGNRGTNLQRLHLSFPVAESPWMRTRFSQRSREVVRHLLAADQKHDEVRHCVSQFAHGFTTSVSPIGCGVRVTSPRRPLAPVAARPSTEWARRSCGNTPLAHIERSSSGTSRSTVRRGRSRSIASPTAAQLVEYALSAESAGPVAETLCDVEGSSERDAVACRRSASRFGPHPCHRPRVRGHRDRKARRRNRWSDRPATG